MLDHSLSNSLIDLAQSSFRESGRAIKPLAAANEFDLVSQSLSLDYRSKKEAAAGFGAVFEGLAFDPLRVRTQAFYLPIDGRPVALMTLVIAPQGWIERQRYLRLEPEGLRVCRAGEVLGIDGTPNYYISPGWASVAKEWQTRFARPGHNFLLNALVLLADHAPPNTWVEAAAQGKHRTEHMPAVAGLEFGQVLPLDKIPFPLEDFGVNSDGSSTTVGLANKANWIRLPQVAHAGTLGPVFVQRSDSAVPPELRARLARAAVRQKPQNH